MKPGEASDLQVGLDDASARYFTVESAQGALVLVRKITQEIVEGYRVLMALRTEREELARRECTSGQLDALEARIQDTVDLLNTLQDELSDIGVELKDWSEGLVDFPALYDDRKVLLCWKLGEDRIGFWHEADAGFAGRQAIGPELNVADPSTTPGCHGRVDRA